MDPELKALLEKANENYTTQKAKNEALEATIKALETKHDAAMKIVDGLKGVEGEALKKAIDQVNELVDEISDLRSKMKAPAAVVLSDEEQKKAFRKLASKAIGTLLSKGYTDRRSLLDLLPSEMETQIKSLNITTPADGGLAVAEVLATDVLDYAFEYSPLLSMLMLKSSLTRNYRQLIRITRPKARRGSENVNGDAKTLTDTQKYAEVKSHVFKVEAQPFITNEALLGTDIDVYADLREGLGEEIADFLVNDLYFGEGADYEARGILGSKRFDITNLTGESFKPTMTPTGVGSRNPDFFPAFATGVSGSIGADDVAIVNFVINTCNKLPTRYRRGAKWVMNTNTKGIFEKVRDADNKPIYSYDFIQGATGRQFLLNGYPVEIDDFMPDVGANEPFAIFGRLDMAMAYNRGDINQLILDPYTRKGGLTVYTEQEYVEMVQRSDAILVCAATANALA